MGSCSAFQRASDGGRCFYIARYFRPCCCNGNRDICEFRRFGTGESSKIVKIDDALLAELSPDKR